MCFFCFFSFIWFLRQIKAVLFWLYLWQLKEYHVGRFIDHFRTEKGKRLILNRLSVLKVFLVFLFFLFFKYSREWLLQNYLVIALFLLFLYLAECIKFFRDILTKELKKPVFTKKTIFLLSVTSVFSFLYLIFLTGRTLLLYLLIFDTLTPFIVSGIVLIFQPFAFLARNRMIQKAKIKREKFKNLLTIGITGSYGKTSTKEILAEILSDKFKVLKTKQHQNSEVGISNCILKELNGEHEIFIAEMGAYNRGGIRLLCSIVKPKIGILTGINEQHMATFGSLENIIGAKLELIESLPEEGTAVLNANNEIIKNLKNKIKNYNSDLKNVKFCSIREKTDIWAEGIKVEKESVSFKAFSKDGDSANFRVSLAGIQNVENLLLAACCAKELGMTFEDISKRCERIEQKNGAEKFLKGISGINVIDSTYSANPTGVISHLDYLNLWQGKKAVVMPCLIELERSSKSVHRNIGKKIAKICDMAIITGKECFPDIMSSAVREGMKRENIFFSENPKDIVYNLKKFLKQGDVVLLEGRISKEIKKLLVR